MDHEDEGSRAESWPGRFAPKTPKSPDSAQTGRTGAQEVLLALERFRVAGFPWPQEVDTGIDLVCFLREGQNATSFVAGLQVKSGDSYTNERVAAVPVGIHADYWRSASLPIFAATWNDGETRVEDVLAVLADDATAASIPCDVALSDAIIRMRTRMRVHAVAPLWAARMRRTRLAGRDPNGFREFAKVFVDQNGERADSRSLELVEQVIAWLRRDDSDLADMREFLSVERADFKSVAGGFLGALLDVLVQTAILLGLQYQAGGIANGAPSSLDDLYAQDLEALTDAERRFLSGCGVVNTVLEVIAGTDDQTLAAERISAFIRRSWFFISPASADSRELTTGVEGAGFLPEQILVPLAQALHQEGVGDAAWSVVDRSAVLFASLRRVRGSFSSRELIEELADLVFRADGA